MPTSPDGILEATFDPAWAAVRLIVDGGMWPAGTRTNRVTNPSFETGVTGWSGTGDESNPTSGGLFGSRHARTTATSAAAALTLNGTGLSYTVTPGEAFAMSAYVRGTVDRTVQIQATWTGAAYATGPTQTIASVSAWQRLTFAGTVPAGATAGRIDIVMQATGVAIGTVLDVDGVLAERGTSTVGDYFDGATTDTVTTEYAWTGTADASTSTAVLRAVDMITMTRSVPGEVAVPVRGLESRAVVGGTYVGSDHEMGLDTSVTYQVDGSNAASLVPGLIASATVTVNTSGAADGMWLKVAGKPDLTVLVRLRTVSDVASPTVGGVYQIVGGGGAVAQTTAQWSGIESDSARLGLSATVGSELARLRAVLAASRVLLLQPVGSTDLDPGWHFIGNARRLNPAQTESYGRRWLEIDVQRTGVPAGSGSGIAGNSWAALMETCATWADVQTTYATWFDVLKGA